MPDGRTDGTEWRSLEFLVSCAVSCLKEVFREPDPFMLRIVLMI